MALRQARRRKRMTITSLIDVIFLLLLFFMLASTFSKFSEVDIELATSGSALSSPSDRPSSELVIKATGALLDGVRVDDADIAAELAHARSPNERLSLSVRVSEDATTQRMMDVLVLLNELKETDIQLLESEV
tara:strand:+ start:365 stop:763 length:399 start_codon:yes stop_codon:yes gene_type:complete